MIFFFLEQQIFGEVPKGSPLSPDVAGIGGCVWKSWKMGGFLKLGVFPPKWMVYNGIFPMKMDDLGEKPTIFGNTHMTLDLVFALSPIIMVQWKTTLNERKLILEGSIFHFHDYGRVMFFLFISHYERGK